MFRMKACYTSSPSSMEVRVKSKNFIKYAVIASPQRGNCRDSVHRYEFELQLHRLMKELIRDELHKKYGAGNWREIESKHIRSIVNSFVSCTKRIQQVKSKIQG